MGNGKTLSTGHRAWYDQLTVHFPTSLLCRVDAHGHGVGAHAAHGPEKVKPEEDIRTDSLSERSDPEIATKLTTLDSHVLAQIIGVFILEFGVLLHR